MRDYQAMNDLRKLPRRTTLQPSPETHSEHLIELAHRKTKANASNVNNRKTPPNKEQKEKQTKEPTLQERLMREDEIIFADDAKVITDHDKPEQIAQKLLNYDIKAPNPAI